MRTMLVWLYLFLAVPAAGAQEVLRDSAVAGTPAGDIRKAWLSGETGRYRHFVLGGDYEAASIIAEDAAGRRYRLEAPEDAVFEDRRLRITDLDGDGRNEIAVVISRAGNGSALALAGLRDGKLVILAETEANGRPNRWLNPSGIGRFTGTGERQIAIVRTPHLSGVLEVYGFQGQSLHRRARLEGYSTHKLGSRHQGMFAVIPKTGGGDLLIVPVLNRRALAVLDFSRERPEVARLPLGGAADGPMKVERAPGGRPMVEVRLEDGRSARLAIPEMTGAR
ncbi:MAG TPA: hypothetical protein PKW21_11450 [Rhabdaerophilum sp.]|nr:hypothetical protein [Rhabdaerophilum sp.]